MGDCDVCCEKYNKNTNKKLVCNSCNFACCRKCMEIYSLNIKDFIQCMNCHRLLSRFEQSEIFTKTFLKTYKNHHSEILFENEKSLMPEAQEYIENSKIKEQIELKIIDLEEKIMRLTFEKNILKDRIYEKNNKGIFEKKIYIKKCGFENCRGFINEQWKCAICSNITCKKCLEICKDKHECNPEVLETVKYIKSDARPCPNCGAFIHKISGCDQMYCTVCHTPFSWKSGKIERGAIHNPHYFEYMRKNNKEIPRAPGDNPCGQRIFDHYTAIGFRSFISNNILQDVLHIQEVEIRRWQSASSTLMDRVRYLNGIIDEKQFKLNIEKKDKEKAKKQEVCSILQTYVDCFKDIAFRIGSTKIKQTEKQALFEEELENLIDFVNGRMRSVSAALGCVTPRIGEKYTEKDLPTRSGFWFF